MRIHQHRLLMSVGLVGLLILAGTVIAVGLSGGPRFSTDGQAASGSGSSSTDNSAGLAASPVPVDRIRYERLGIDLPIIEGDGIDAPLDTAAHFPGSGWPGDGTNIYVYGHAREGLFIRLKEARPGDRVVIVMANGSAHAYDVAKIVPDAAWNAMEYADPTPTEQLTLQTSTSEDATDPRFIVIAYPAP